jgi:hypothetical protein
MTDRTLFYIDTSALIRVFRFYPKELVKSMWKRLEKLFTSGIMISHIFVYEEITTEAKNSDFLSKCITPLRSCFKRTTFTQANLVKKIIEEFPGIIDVQKEKNQADPWLIALAIERKGELDLFSSSKKLYLVSEESEIKPFRIPAVCKKYGINHINLEGFYKMQDWSFKLF